MEFQPVRVEIVLHGGGAGFPWNLYTKMTETLRQIKTTFPMNMDGCNVYGYDKVCIWI